MIDATGRRFETETQGGCGVLLFAPLAVIVVVAGYCVGAIISPAPEPDALDDLTARVQALEDDPEAQTMPDSWIRREYLYGEPRCGLYGETP